MRLSGFLRLQHQMHKLAFQPVLRSQHESCWNKQLRQRSVYLSRSINMETIALHGFHDRKVSREIKAKRKRWNGGSKKNKKSHIHEFNFEPYLPAPESFTSLSLLNVYEEDLRKRRRRRITAESLSHSQPQSEREAGLTGRSVQISHQFFLFLFQSETTQNRTAEEIKPHCFSTAVSTNV